MVDVIRCQCKLHLKLNNNIYIYMMPCVWNKNDFI